MSHEHLPHRNGARRPDLVTWSGVTAGGRPVKRFLFLIMAVIIAASTYDYARSAGHYGLIVVVGVLAAFLLADKFVG
jgi:hypothetical protein